MGNEKAARLALLEGLKNPIDRDGAIAFFQEPGPEPPSDYARRLRLRTDALMSDPVLRTEMLKYGRILPFRSNAGAPPEQPAHPPAPPSDAPAVSELSPPRAAPPALASRSR
jgi:hypothetical protein